MLEQALALLEAGRARIAAGWCQGAFARVSEGKPVPADSPEAVSWCAIGGLGGWGESLLPVWGAAFDALVAHKPPRISLADISLSAWNDTPERTQDDVLALYDRAIADLRAKIEKEASHV